MLLEARCNWMKNTNESDFCFTVGIVNEQEVDSVRDNIITLNCSVAYMSQCMPWTKCKASCQSMGAQSYRWFHDGCCECVGDKCINYGIAESRYINIWNSFVEPVCSNCGLVLHLMYVSDVRSVLRRKWFSRIMRN